MTLLDKTVALLAARPRTLTLAAIAAAAGVEKEWLAKFSKGVIADPGVRKVQALHDYLARRK